MGKKNWIQPLAATLVLIVFSTFLYTAGSVGRLSYIEEPLQDFLRKTKSVDEREPEDRIKIVKIDDKSLKAIGKFPWDRAIYAQIIEKLEQSGAAAIGIDVVMAEPSKNPPQMIKHWQMFWPNIIMSSYQFKSITPLLSNPLVI
ncbi:CHASE2 domain-containing protein [Paenibacillus hexagrammi]|uniref:CHASE2 domain-containing protein n=1 Tax=Paenibacillus hexagrammi TaxID=2908839 RepID=A0ABY3SC82_9BACL|nr:CHASE2 domain-containing protein [Paenibacillus sp. YPD9-1]UJF31589.1 CHASE2 domain-containing protein [Paenibacillus sp. YPD9-1]